MWESFLVNEIRYATFWSQNTWIMQTILNSFENRGNTKRNLSGANKQKRHFHWEIEKWIESSLRIRYRWSWILFFIHWNVWENINGVDTPEIWWGRKSLTGYLQYCYSVSRCNKNLLFYRLILRAVNNFFEIKNEPFSFFFSFWKNLIPFNRIFCLLSAIKFIFPAFVLKQMDEFVFLQKHYIIYYKLY